MYAYVDLLLAFVGVTLSDYILVLLPLVSLHGSQERILQSFQVSCFQVAVGRSSFSHGFFRKVGSLISRPSARSLVGGLST